MGTGYARTICIRTVFYTGFTACFIALGTPVYCGESLSVRLPPLVHDVEDTSGSGGWQVTGTISGSPIVASGDFGLCLNSQGWYCTRRISMGSGAETVRLTRWTKGSRRLLLMVWESGAGKTRFALGEEKDNGEKQDKE